MPDTVHDVRLPQRALPDSLSAVFPAGVPFPPFHATELGALFAGDCLHVLPSLAEGSVDTVFADPPFNIGKQYGRGFDDAVAEADYVGWCGRWLDACIRALKPGGALFVYNLPKWNILLGARCMARGMEFRHDIAVEMKNGFPIPGRLYPSRYSLLYLTKGRPATFRKIRTPLRTCRHCGGEVADYGGHRSKMHPSGATLTDLWTDIPVVRHRRYKPSGRGANTLSTKLVDRCVEMSTVPGDLVLDPFGGAGTTFAVAEARGRRWIGVELNDADVIVDRLVSGDVAHHPNDDRVEG